LKTKFLEVDTDSVEQRCSENYLQLDVQGTKLIHFTHSYNVSDVSVLRTGRTNNLGAMFDVKLHFNCHADYEHFQGLGILGPICYITCSFYTLDNIVILHT
jgi:hypothetical protein